MDYGGARSARLTFKGDKKPFKKHKKKKKEKKRSHSSDEGESSAAGWRKATSVGQLKGTIAVRWSDGRFIGAKDNGSLELWVSEDAPNPEPAQMFTVIRPNETQIALKTGYGKFISVDNIQCKLEALTEAIGPLEHFEPVFQEGKTAMLSGAKNNFVTACRGELFASAPSVKGDNEICEFVYESTGDDHTVKKSKIADPKKIARKAGLSREDIKKLEAEGASIYEAIVDKRSKGKSDKFCK
ncbi:protein FRG1 homolog [Galendromus occidentalis]|uniref:Protein FRG1 homolog n=1 Tax=Galendromus occidentalis TaxID=34638 RepID=A0AAJ6VWB6_9ACAR|nr:protein FRG1 homolog [Galendromus occidentalis]